MGQTHMRAVCFLISLLVAGCHLPSQIAVMIPAISALGPSSRLADTAPTFETPTAPPERGTAYIVIGPEPANARIEPVTIGPIYARLEPGETVIVVATISAQMVGNSNQWHVIERDGRRLYVHSSRLEPAP